MVTLLGEHPCIVNNLLGPETVHFREVLLYITYSILHIRPLNLVLIKKNQQLHSRSQYWNDNEAAPANGGFVHKANVSGRVNE